MKRAPFLSTAAVWIFLVAGIALRLWYYLDARSLFIDEANLALNIAELSYSQFFHPLLYDQYAPPLFMVWSKGAVQLLGNHEWALRLLPLAGSFFLLFAFLRLARVLQLAPTIQWFPIAMLSLSPFLLRFSTELKQYSTDAALALGLILVALQLPPDNIKSKHFWLWAAAGSLSLWFSMPAAFVLTGVGAYYFLGFLRQKRRKALFTFVLVGTAWIVSFIILYLTVLKAGTEREVLIDYHAAYFFPVRLWEAEAWKQLGNIFYGLLSPVLGFTIVGLITGTSLLFWGIFQLYQQKRDGFILILLPILTCFAASAFQLFSLIPRVSLFLMPLFVLLAAFGASQVWQSGGRNIRFALLALLVLEAAPFFNSLYRLGQPTVIEDLRSVLLDMKATDMAGPAYIDNAAVPAYRYYSQWHHQKQQYRLPEPVLLSWDSNLKNILEEQQQAGTGFWLVFSQLVSETARNKKREKEEIARSVAVEKIRIEPTGAGGYGYAYKRQ